MFRSWLLKLPTFFLVLLMCFSGWLSAPPHAWADAGSFNSSADAYLSSGSPNVNNSTNVIMDLTNTRDGVVRFDISSIPTGSTVTAATLTLVATAVGSATAVKNYGSNRILVDWTESTVTWNTPGSTAGSHFASSATDIIAVSATGSYNWNVLNDVASFVAGSAINYGWRIIWSSNTSGTNKQVDFGTKENATAGNRPVLSVTYTPPDSTAPTAVSNLALSSPSNSTMTVSWTAPGDDGSTGTATSYDLRYSTSAITSGNFSSATQITGEPVPQVAGTSESMIISSLSTNTTYFFAIKTSDEVPNTSLLSNVPSLATLPGDAPPSTSSGGGGGPRIVTFSGQAYPGSTIEVLRKSFQDNLYIQIPTESTKILEDGSFTITHISNVGDDYFFALRVQDKDGRSTGVLTFDTPLIEYIFDKKNILVPPTIGFEKSIVAKNDSIKIMGYAAPNNVVELELDESKYKEIKVNQSGFWSTDIDARYLSYGEHHGRARQTDAKGKVSSFGVTRIFKISRLPVSSADLNSDGIVNVIDWSIFFFRWGSDKEELKLQNDINGDGKINIFDFSIFLQTIKL